MTPPERPLPMRRRRFHRAVFLAAGAYNLAWGAASALWPHALFDFAGMPRLNYPEVWQCLAMVVGLYGLAYWEVARRPERGFAIAAVGLLGKVLGPIGAAWAIARPVDPWPLAFAALNLANDLVWWIPFGLYLHDAWPHYRADWHAHDA